MIDAPLFSAEALAILDAQPFDPGARPFYDVFSDGLVWPDEFPRLSSASWRAHNPGMMHRYLLACRRELTLGEYEGARIPGDPGVNLMPIWEQIALRAPNWPGLRPRRRGPGARRVFVALQREANRRLKALEGDPDTWPE